jgi:serine protease inhibitor ecotin
MKTLTIILTDKQAIRLEQRAAELHLSVQMSVQELILQSLDQHGSVHGKSRNSLEGWGEAFKRMNNNGDDLLSD